MGLNPKCSLCRSPHPLTSLRILVSRIFETPCQSCLTDLRANKARTTVGPTWFQDWDQVGLFPRWWEVLHSKNCDKYLDKWGHDNSMEDASGPYLEYCLGLVPCRTWEPGWHLEPPRCWLNQTHLHKQRCMLTLPHQSSQWLTVLTGCSLASRVFLIEFKRAVTLVWPGGWGSSNSHQLSTQLPVWLSSGSGLSNEELQLSFRHSFSWLVIDLCRRMT